MYALLQNQVIFFFFYCRDNDYMNVNQNTLGIQIKVNRDASLEKKGETILSCQLIAERDSCHKGGKSGIEPSGKPDVKTAYVLKHSFSFHRRDRSKKSITKKKK